MFIINDNDNALVVKTKREGNVILRDIIETQGMSSPEYTNKKAKIAAMVESFEVLGKVCKNDTFTISYAVADMSRIVENGILAPLTLKDDEFEQSPDNICLYVNTRCPSVRKERDGIHYTDAYHVNLKHMYIDKDQAEVVIAKDQKLSFNTLYVPIYMTSGGVFTGEYFCNCYLRPETVEHGHYTPRDSVGIPMSIILKDGKAIYCIDKREPKFKALSSFYHVPIHVDETMRGAFDIRKYKKLNKKNVKPRVQR